MDTASLETAYRRLLDVVRAGGFRPPPDTADWPAELWLAHVVATARLLTATTAELLAGDGGTADGPRYDNLAATVEAHLAEIGRAAGDWDGLVASARQAGLELVLVARHLGDARAATALPVRIRQGAALRVDTRLPWAGVLRTHAEVHLPEQQAAFEALR